MSYDKHNPTLRRLSFDFNNWKYPKESVYVPEGVTVDRALALDRQTANGDYKTDPLGFDNRKSWHEHKAKYNKKNDDVLMLHSEILRHDTLRLHLIEDLTRAISDTKHDSKRLRYFTSNYVRYQFWAMSCLATLDNGVVTIGFVAETLNIARTTLRKVIKECLEADWITAHEVDGNVAYQATDQTVNTYFLRMRRFYVDTTPAAQTRKTAYESLVRYENEWERKYSIE